MRRLYPYVLSLSLLLMAISCEDKPEVKDTVGQFIEYSILKSHNPDLEEDIIFEID